MSSKQSPRFTFLGLPVEARNEEGDRWVDAYPNHDEPRLKFAETGQITFVSVPGHPSEPTDLAWPQPGTAPVEIAEIVLKVVKRVDPERQNETLCELRRQIEEFLASDADS